MSPAPSRRSSPAIKALGEIFTEGCGSRKNDPRVALFFETHSMAIIRAIFPGMCQLEDGSWHAPYVTSAGPPYLILKINREFTGWQIESRRRRKSGRISGASIRSLLAHFAGKQDLTNDDLAILLGRALAYPAESKA